MDRQEGFDSRAEMEVYFRIVANSSERTATVAAYENDDAGPRLV